jgi:ribosome maturation factor RimP
MTAPHAAPVDQAMGLELQAIELENELEWAEAQGRVDDIGEVHRQLVAVLDELGAVADRIAA